MIVFKSLLYLIFVAGVFAVYIPLAFLRTGLLINLGILSFLAFPLWAAGGSIILWCFWAFISKGRGTPNPANPPSKLVITGLYHYVRNPIYIGVIAVFLGYFFWFGYLTLLLYSLIAFLVTDIFVILYEEPHLKKKFGDSYKDYLNKVPRWIPKFK